MLAYVRQQTPDHQIILCGFSFGSYLAAKMAERHPEQVQHLITIAPPIALFEYPAASSLDCPWHLLQALDDEIVDAHTNLNWASQHPSIQVTQWTTAGHFFHGQMPKIMDWAWQSLSSTFDLN